MSSDPVEAAAYPRRSDEDSEAAGHDGGTGHGADTGHLEHGVHQPPVGTGGSHPSLKNRLIAIPSVPG